LTKFLKKSHFLIGFLLGMVCFSTSMQLLQTGNTTLNFDLSSLSGWTSGLQQKQQMSSLPIPDE